MQIHPVFMSITAGFAKHWLEGIFSNLRLVSISTLSTALSEFFPASQKLRGEITCSMSTCHSLQIENTFVA